jgi:WD40 repeat protein
VPPASPLGPPDQILVSGWYDGHVRVHDLRSSTRVSTINTVDGPAPLIPVLESHFDPWCLEPIYSVSCGGGSSAFIAAGVARHSLVAFWDVRYPKRGWSVHAPGNDPSPVYAIILESSRLFGATQSRPFVYDFGPGVTHDTYPWVQYPSDADSFNYYVTRYSHLSGTE